MLEYDNSAFYYFTLAMCFVYIVPVTYFSLKRIIIGLFFTKHLLDNQKPRSSREKETLEKMLKERGKLANLFNWKFILNLVVLGIAWYLFVLMIYLVQDNSEIKTFDPFAILGIAAGASSREIKRAYRKMSLQYHPDKNIDNPLAESKFMMVAKAYEALTDPVAKENFEKYGNPDGRQPLSLSIGLPTFLLDPANHNVILLIYLMVLVIVIPSVVALWYTQSKKYGDSMIMYDSYGFYNYLLSEHAHAKMMPEILAGSAEFREIPLRDSDNADLAALMRDMKQDNIFPKPRHNHPLIMKANILIHAYLHRIPLTPSLRADLNVMLKQAIHLIEGMLEICTMKGWLQTSIFVIDFMQFMTQALYIKDSSLLQIPHFTEVEVRHCTTGKSAMKTLEQFIKADPESRKGMNKFSDEDREEVERVCKIFPDIDLELHVGVDDEEEIAEGDIMTLTIKMTRKNVPEGEECSLVYCPEFPFPRKERWIALLGDIKTNRLHAISKITAQSRVVEDKIMFQAPPHAGTYQLELFLKCDSYIGLDIRRTVRFTVIPADSLPKYEPHPEDLELDNEPTLFEQVLTGNIDDDSSESEAEVDDESDDSGDEINLTEAQKKKRKERIRRRNQGKGGEDETSGDDATEGDKTDDKKNS